MSLKEEISEFLTHRNVEYPTHTAKDILLKVEKRIDSLQPPYDTGEGELTYGWERAIGEIKEMLK